MRDECGWLELVSHSALLYGPLKLRTWGCAANEAQAPCLVSLWPSKALVQKGFSSRLLAYVGFGPKGNCTNGWINVSPDRSTHHWGSCSEYMCCYARGHSSLNSSCFFIFVAFVVCFSELMLKFALIPEKQKGILLFTAIGNM